MFSSIPPSFPTLKTATNPNLENQPPYAAVSVLIKPQHMVVFLSLEIVTLPQSMNNPQFSNRGDSRKHVIVLTQPIILPTSRYSSKAHRTLVLG